MEDTVMHLLALFTPLFVMFLAFVGGMAATALMYAVMAGLRAMERAMVRVREARRGL